ncbi:MAG: four helix bundle protein [Anaerolineales bacterium]|nr:four helix bundle protein [Anaerolineales bacterium]
MRRSSGSVGAQICRRHGQNVLGKAFQSKFTDADGEQHETQHWGLQEFGYLSKEAAC